MDDGGLPAPERARLRRATGRALVLAAAVVVVLQVALAALGSAAGVGEARLVDAAFAALQPVGDAPAPVGLDQLAARVQLSTYAELTGAFDRHAQVLTGARELAVVATVALLGAVVALARSLGVRPWALGAVLLVLAVCPPAVAALTTAGPGLLGAAWATVGAALLVRDRTWQLVAGILAVVAAVVTAPVLAVPLLVVAATFPIAVRRRRGALPLAVALVGTALPLALVPAPGGAAAIPALVVVAVLVGAVLVDELGGRAEARLPTARWGAVVVGTALAVVALAVVVVPAPAAVSRVRAAVDGAPGLAAWLAEATEPTTGVAPTPGVWADLVRAGVAPARLTGGTLAVDRGAPDGGAVLARFGRAGAALIVVGPGAPVGASGSAPLADHPDLVAPEEVRALLRAGAVDPRTVAALAGLVERGRVTLVDLPALPGEEPAVPRHRAVLAGVDAGTLEWLGTRPPPLAPIATPPGDASTAVLTWPLPAP